MNQNIIVNNEIDWKNVFSSLWRGKIYIILSSIVSIFLGSLYLHSAEKKYTIEYKLKPVVVMDNARSFSGLNNLASFAGIQLPTNKNNDLNIYKELIISAEVSEIIFDNKEFIKEIFKSEWNEYLSAYSRQPKSKIQILISDAKELLIGNNEGNYIPPNPRRLSDYIANNIQINEDKETGFLSVKSVTSKPKLILSIILKATEASDKIMRQRYISFSTEPLVFYKEKLLTARSREHREVLAELIRREEQKLMFASKGKYFIAEPYISPTISLHPTAPKPKLILTLSLVLGLFLGVALVLMQRAIKKEN